MYELISEFISEDLKFKSQYGNPKKISIQHYLINMPHKILTSLNVNSVSTTVAVIFQMVDWSQVIEVKLRTYTILYMHGLLNANCQKK